MTELDSSEAGRRFAELVKVMAILRERCPWDRKQTFASIKPYTLEETYEVLDAIDGEDWPNLCEELGDFILQAVFYGEIARGQGLFSIEDSLGIINSKLIRRHPHVFADGDAKTEEQVKRRWDEIKRQEKSNRPMEVSSRLESVSRQLPALAEAQNIGRKAAGFGFDWPDRQGVLEKVVEEARELEGAQQADGAVSQAETEHELGDLLFSVVNLARWLGVDAEGALRKANTRFRKRFAHVESGVAGESAPSLQRMEELWIEAKGRER